MMYLFSLVGLASFLTRLSNFSLEKRKHTESHLSDITLASSVDVNSLWKNY